MSVKDKLSNKEHEAKNEAIRDSNVTDACMKEVQVILDKYECFIEVGHSIGIFPNSLKGKK